MRWWRMVRVKKHPRMPATKGRKTWKKVCCGILKVCWCECLHSFEVYYVENGEKRDDGTSLVKTKTWGMVFKMMENSWSLKKKLDYSPIIKDPLKISLIWHNWWTKPREEATKQRQITMPTAHIFAIFSSSLFWDFLFLHSTAASSAEAMRSTLEFIQQFSFSRSSWNWKIVFKECQKHFLQQ